MRSAARINSKQVSGEIKTNVCLVPGSAVDCSTGSLVYCIDRNQYTQRPTHRTSALVAQAERSETPSLRPQHVSTRYSIKIATLPRRCRMHKRARCVFFSPRYTYPPNAYNKPYIRVTSRLLPDRGGARACVAPSTCQSSPTSVALTLLYR